MSPTQKLIMINTGQEFRLFEAAIAGGQTLQSVWQTVDQMIKKGLVKKVRRGVYRKTNQQ